MFCLQIRCGSSCSLTFIMVLSTALLFTIIFLIEDSSLCMFYMYLILTNIFRFDPIFFAQPSFPSWFSYLLQWKTISSFKNLFSRLMLHCICKHMKKSFLLTFLFVAVHPSSYRGAFASLFCMFQRHCTEILFQVSLRNSEHLSHTVSLPLQSTLKCLKFLEV